MLLRNYSKETLVYALTEFSDNLENMDLTDKEKNKVENMDLTDKEKNKVEMMHG